MVHSIISPSVLASDFGNLTGECTRMIKEGADWLHMDVMDGHFVENITMGAPILECVSKGVPGIFMDCHMMVAAPEKWVSDIAKAGGSLYTFHFEATKDPLALIAQIKAAGMKAGMAISPDTPSSAVTDEIAEAADMILVMTVYPGRGGQKFKPECLPKVTELRARFPSMDIQVDGGVGPSTIHVCASAGSNVIVAGSAIFGAPDSKKVISELRAVVDEALKKAAGAPRPVPTSPLPPEKILSILSPPPPTSSSRISLPKLLALLVLLAFLLLRLFTFYYQNLYDPSSSYYGPATPPVHPTIGISLSRTCSEASYEPFEVDFRHAPSEASPGWRRIPWPESSPWEERDGEEEGGDWCRRGGEEGEGVWAEPNSGDLVSRIVERMEHASAFLEKTVTRAVVSVPSGWSFETLEKIRHDLPALLPSNLKVTLQQHYISALQLLPLPSPRWVTKDKDTWSSNILVVDVDKEWGNTTLALVRTKDHGYDVMGVRTSTAYCGLYEAEIEVRMTIWEPEQFGRELDGLLRDVRVGRTRLKREDVDVIVLTSSHHRNLSSLQTVLESAFVNNTKVKINPFDFPSEGAIVRGASRSAMFQEAVESWGDTCSMTVDWNPFALGLTDQNGAFHQIKDVGNPYQIQPDLTITTTVDEQTSLALEVSEFIPQENATLSIGHVVLTGLPPRPAGVLQLHIDLRLDEDQRTIEVVARSLGPHSPKFSQVLELRSKKDSPSHSGWKETVPSSRSDL